MDKKPLEKALAEWAAFCADSEAWKDPPENEPAPPLGDLTEEEEAEVENHPLRGIF